MWIITWIELNWISLATSQLEFFSSVLVRIAQLNIPESVGLLSGGQCVELLYLGSKSESGKGLLQYLGSGTYAVQIAAQAENC